MSSLISPSLSPQVFNTDDDGNALFDEHPLHVAIIKNNTELVDLLLNRGADVNTRNSEDMTPLHVASLQGQLIIAEKLLGNGASIESAITETNSRSGFTPLHCAVEAGSREMTELLLKNNANIDAKTKDGWTPLDISVYKENLIIADNLMINGASVNSVCTTFAQGLILLHLAISRGNLGLVKGLLKYGAYVDHQSGSDKTTLQFAIAKNQTTMIAFIFVSRLSVQNKSMKNVLLEAVDASRVEYNDLITHLLSSTPGIFSHIDSQNYGNVDAAIRLFVHAAIEKGFSKVVEDFLKCGKELSVLKKGEEGYTFLHAAAKNRRYKIAKLLMDYGANVNAKYKNQRTPFFYAFRNADANMTKILLSKGVNNRSELFNAAIKTVCKEIVEVFLDICSVTDINGTNAFGNTALHLAARSYGPDQNKAEVVRLLRSRGANSSICNKNGLTPLHVAVEEDCPMLVEALLEDIALKDTNVSNEVILNSSAKIDAQSPWGMTALHMACRDSHIEIVETLLKYGADVDIKTQFRKTAIDVAFDMGRKDVFQSLTLRGADIDGFYLDNIMSNNFKSVFRRPSCVKFYDSVKAKLVIKMTAAKLYNVSWPITDNEERIRILNRYRKTCDQEIEKAKNAKICRNVCFYDVLTKDLQELARYSRNGQIAQALESENLSEMFPIYFRMIEYNLKKGKQRNKLLHLSMASFSSLTGYSLPMDILIAEIFRYFENEDLENIIEAKYGTGMFR